ncbi:MAG: type II toxin-antitoxin system RelE/ParE family toxin [Syntrophorhabdales bacterium]
MICQFKKTFLKDLAELPAAYRKKIEKLVFEEFPGMSSLSDKLDIRKIQGYENYYRIRIGHYRIGCEIEAGNRISFYRVKDRKDIYRVFP